MPLVKVYSAEENLGCSGIGFYKPGCDEPWLYIDFFKADQYGIFVRAGSSAWHIFFNKPIKIRRHY